MELDLLVKNVRVWGTDTMRDVAIDDGRFVDLALTHGLPQARRTIDAEGRLAVAGFIEPHIHLDKALIAERAPINRSGTLDEAIAILWAQKRAYDVNEVADRAGRVIEMAIVNGITHMRSHVDVDPIGGLKPAQGVLKARDKFRGLIDIQLVAFPQEGIIKAPGTEELMHKAMELGVDVVGGMPFNEASIEDSRRHIEIAFEIARAFDADIDMHVDETDDPSARTLEILAELTIANGWQGRVTAGHTCALSAYPRDYADRVIARLCEARIHMIANPATNLMLQGRLDEQPKRRGITRVKELWQAGANVACGQDCVRDTFYPFGRSDPLEIAFLAAHAAHLSQPPEIEAALDMVTRNAANVLRLAEYGVRPGAPADLVILDAHDPREAIATQAVRRWVIKRGQLLAETIQTRRTYFQCR
jgi:cytosine deaminase